jgi:protein-disulfide isomerase
MSKRQELREKKARTQRNQRILIVVGVGLVALAIAGILILTNLPAKSAAGPILSAPDHPRPQADFNAMGDPNAPVKIVEFSDFQCPYCARFWKETEPQLVEEYVKTGKVYFVFRSMGNFVSNNITRQSGGSNNESELAAQAAYCAGDQQKFWEYHDTLFANQLGENEGYFVRQRLDAYAQAIGLEPNAFKDCMDSKKYKDKVTQDGLDGEKAGVQGTPSFLINGKLVEGALPFDKADAETDFKREIEAALKAAGAQ